MSPDADNYYDHPVFHPDRLRLKTPALAKLQEDLTRMLWTGSTGGLITGPVRVGKTTATRWISTELCTRDGISIPCYYISVPPRDRRTVLSVFRHLCWSVGLRAANHDRADHLSDRFVHYITDQAAARGCRSAVLIVDEMQRLTPLQFGPFAELHDRLRLLDILLTVFFVGNAQESSDLIEEIEQPHNAHIYGRFFTQRSSFLGLTNKRAVKSCLSQYDRLKYPDDGPTYTEHFLPEAVRGGWKFASLAGDLWSEFRGYQRAYHIESWGMQYFTVTVNTLLADFLPARGIDNFGEEMVRECIAISGLVPELVRPV
jgi:hypothetical protein